MDVFQRICGNGEEEEEIIHFYVPEDHSVPGLCGNRGIRVEYVTHTPRHLESPLAATARAGGSFTPYGNSFSLARAFFFSHEGNCEQVFSRGGEPVRPEHGA